MIMSGMKGLCTLLLWGVKYVKGHVHWKRVPSPHNYDLLLINYWTGWLINVWLQVVPPSRQDFSRWRVTAAQLMDSGRGNPLIPTWLVGDGCTERL